MPKRIYVSNLPVKLEESKLAAMTAGMGQHEIQEFGPGTATFVTPGGHIYKFVDELKARFTDAGFQGVTIHHAEQDAD